MSQLKKPSRPVTQQSLRNAALRYIDRYATSSENLKQVLMRRVHKSHHMHDTDIEEGRRWIDELVMKLMDGGFLNDRTYAEMRAMGLHRKGQSERMIVMKLKEKGLGEEIIHQALDYVKSEIESPDLEKSAATALAKRRRLGPWRAPEKRADFKDKDLAALARAGFSYDLARKVIEAESPEDLETLD